MKSLRFIAVTLLSMVALYACGGTTSSADSGGLTQPQVQALINTAIAPLQQQVTTLQTEVTSLQGSSSPAVFIQAPNAPAVKVQLKTQLRNKSTSTTTTCTGLGTLTGRPNSSDPLSTDNISGVSCTGYYFTVSGAAASTDNALIQPPPSSVTVGYDSPGCTGNAYALESFNGTGITQGAVANGAVFTVGDPTNAANYLMLKAGTAATTPNILSVLQKGSCISFSGALSGYALVTNDSTVSGVPSAPIPGPVTIG